MSTINTIEKLDAIDSVAAGDRIPVADASAGYETKYATPSQIMAAAGTQELTATGAVTAGVRNLRLNHASTIIAATIADAADHQGFFAVTNTSASGTAAHTVTLTSGTWDGTNNVATLNAPAESLLVFFDENGDGTIVVNTGSVALS